MDYLKECLFSVLNQTYVNLEVIVIDDGSSDNTHDTVKEIDDSRIVYINAGRTGDVGKLRNLGIDSAKGTFIAFCDDDDKWKPEKLSIQLSELNDFKMICSNAAVMDEMGIEVAQTLHDNILSKRTLDLSCLLMKNLVITSSVLMTKELSILKFPEKKSSVAAEDYELWLKIASIGENISFLPDSLVLFRKHSSTSSHGNVKGKIELLENVLRVLGSYSMINDPEISLTSKKSILHKKIELLRLNLSVKPSILEVVKSFIRILFSLSNVRVLFYYFKFKLKH
ncbi:MAG: glycosyltransferase [Ignavibacteria bacterium]|nr:glycosyltransferase [Ignavibacteria bacterium]